MGGIFAGDCERLSVQSTFPQLVELERRHGSLVRGVLATRPPSRGGPPPSAFLSLRGGMAELPEALEAEIRGRGAEIHTGLSLRAIGAGMAPSAPLRVVADDPRGEALAIDADHVVLATPAHAAGPALAKLAPEAARELEAIEYVSTATMLLAFDRAAVPHPMDAVGVVLPKGAGRRALAITFVTSKWEDRAPDGTAVLRVFFGGHLRQDDASRSDEELSALAREELAQVLGVRAEPRHTAVFRYPRGSPQPVVGHGARVERIRRKIAAVPGLHVAGAAYDGVGIPDCVRQGGQVAERILALL
jgi:oxygen-dependent protoporphyrinogen oxidase